MKNNEVMPKPIILEPDTRTVRIPVSDNNIFIFPDGVPAFEDYHEFIVYNDTEMQPFFFMKSIGISPEINFVCVDPFLVCPEYQVRIERSDLQSLRLKRGEDAFVFSIVTVNDNPCEITTNLKGPVVINMKNKLGRQVICEGARHDVKYRVWDALSKITHDEEMLTDDNFMREAKNCL